MLLDYAIRSTVLLALTGAAVLLMRGRSSAWRHIVWLAGLLTLLALPAARAIAPQWTPPVAAQRFLAAAVPTRTVITVHATNGSDWSSLDWLLIIWLAGVAFFLIRAFRAQVLAARLAQQATTGPNGARISDEIEVPMVCGLFNPVIVLPADSAHWPAARLESVLRHERMHIARRDTLAQALARITCALYWPQPLVWLAASAMRGACEHACDDGVLSQGTKPSAYAEHLMEIARALQPPAGVTFEGGIAMTRTNQLEKRISALLNINHDRRQASTSFTATVTGVALAVVVSLAALQTPLFAQSGKLSGVVRDPSQAVVPHARIDVKSTAGKDGKPMHEVVYSNAVGEFSLDIPDGIYDITIAAPGFAKQDQQGVKFEGSTARRMEMTLNVGAIEERVNVQSELDPTQQKLLAEKLAAERAAMGAVSSAAPAMRPQRIRVGGNVQAANLIRKVTPLYPPTAKLDRVEGTVIMAAVIGKDGTIVSLEQVNKLVDSRLAEAAMEAVKQWIYKPTLLNGEPIEVITQIDVNFTLSR